MNETARTDDSGPDTSDAVSGIGTAVSAVTMAATVVPVRRGVDEVVLLAAAAFAVAAVGCFLGARYDLLERRTGGASAALSSVAVVLLTGYALNRGVGADTALPGVSWSPSTALVAFVAAGLAAGVGVAEYHGVGVSGLAERGSRTAALSVLGLGGLFAAAIATNLLWLPVAGVFGSLSEVQGTALSQLGTALGTAALALGYVAWTEYGRSYFDVRVPTVRDVVWTVAGVVVIFGALFSITILFSTTGVETSDHGSVEQARQNPELLLVLVPASILVIGPFEELLYRNVVQKGLYETFSRYGAVVVASVIFALVHAPAYGVAGAGSGEVIASLAVVFGLAIVLGTIYERTENLLVPGVVHGIYNAIVFASLLL